MRAWDVMPKSHTLSVVAGLIASVVTSGCGCWANEETARIWQENYQAALVPGYQNLKVVTCDGDIGWSLFSYELPASTNPIEVIPLLRRQITGITVPMSDGMSSQWIAVREDGNELHLRSVGYDDWRIRVEARRKVTAMYAGLDSQVQRDAYPRLLAVFERACRE